MLMDIFILLVAGFVAGLLAGFFGMGGGTIMVPMLWYILPVLGFPKDLSVKIATATSLSVIMLIHFFIARTHLLKKTLDIKELKNFVLFAAAGVALGVTAMHFSPPHAIRKVFGILLFLVSLKILFPIERLEFSISDRVLLPCSSFLAAFFSALLGIAGGAVFGSIMFSFSRSKVNRIIAFSSSLGLINATFGTALYMFIYYGRVNHWGMLGYVFLPATVFMSVSAYAGSRIGLNLLYAVNSERVKKLFAVVLMAVSLKILLT